MRLVALTGGISCGKTTVADYFREKYGITVVDADRITHEVQQPGTPVFKKLVETFGREIVQEDGTLDRKKLGEIVFNNETERRKLNRIVHPAVMKQIMMNIAKGWITRKSIVIADIPLFFEIRTPQKWFNDIITVAVSEEVQLGRLMQRNQLTEDAARSRIKAQMPLEKKCEMSTIVLNNNGSVDDLKKEIDEIVAKWERESVKTYFPDPLKIVMALASVVVFIVAAKKYFGC